MSLMEGVENPAICMGIGRLSVLQQTTQTLPLSFHHTTLDQLQFQTVLMVKQSQLQSN